MNQRQNGGQWVPLGTYAFGAGASGAIVLRTQVARGPEASQELAQAFQLGLPVDGQVTGTNKGGVEVTIAGIRAFCPISQLDNKFVENPEDVYRPLPTSTP